MIDHRQDRGPCRHSCRHYDCVMDRGEQLPAHVTAYQGGVLYHAAIDATAEATTVAGDDGIAAPVSSNNEGGDADDAQENDDA